MEDDITIAGTLNGRPDMDFVAVYDGHGGKEASEFAAKHLYKVKNPRPNSKFVSAIDRIAPDFGKQAG